MTAAMHTTTTTTTTQPQHHSILAKLSATIGHHRHSSQSEQKLARMRAAYASGTGGSAGKTQKADGPASLSPRISNSLSSLPTERKPTELLDPNLDRHGSVSVADYCLPSPSIMELAKSAGLLSLNPSDLVFESSVLGIAYYDFVLSVSEVELLAPAAAEQDETSTTMAPQHQQKMDISSNKTNKLLTKRRVHETGSAPLDRMPKIGDKMSTNCGQQNGAAGPMQRKRGQTMEKVGRTSLVVMLQKQRTDLQLLNAKNKPCSLSALMQQNFEKCSMSEIQEKCDDTDMDNNNTTNANSKSRSRSKSPNLERKKCAKTVYRIFLAKFDAKTNVQWFESVLVPRELLERNGIPVSELSLLTMGILVWRCTLNNARLLCLVNGMQREHMHEDGNATAVSFEALKRAACKYKCMHHVLTIGQRRPSAGSTHSSGGSSSSRRSSCASVTRTQTQQEIGMKLRILMCQSRCELPEVPPQAIRETKFLLSPSSNPLLCLCFPLT